MLLDWVSGMTLSITISPSNTIYLKSICRYVNTLYIYIYI